MLCSIAGCWPGCSTHRSLTPLLAGHASCHKCEALIERGIAVEICTTDLSTQINPLADPPHDATAKLIYYTLIAAYHVDGWGGGPSHQGRFTFAGFTHNLEQSSGVHSGEQKIKIKGRCQIRLLGHLWPIETAISHNQLLLPLLEQFWVIDQFEMNRYDTGFLFTCRQRQSKKRNKAVEMTMRKVWEVWGC